MLIKKSFCLLLLIFFTSCSAVYEPMPKSWNWGAKPRPLTGVRGFPPADTDYGKGFVDGCQAAWKAVSRGLLSDFAGKGINPKLIGTNDYDIGWGDGIEQCTYILDWEIV